MRQPDRRVSDRMVESRDVRLTWPRAQMGVDLAEFNARCGGHWARGKDVTPEVS